MSWWSRTVAVLCAIPISIAMATGVAAAPDVADGNGDGVAQVGEHLIYSFTLTNSGNSVIVDPVIVDPMLAGATPPVAVTCAVGDDVESTGESRAPDFAADIVGGWNGELAVGDILTCTGTYTVTQADVDAQVPLVNVAHGTGTDEFGDPIEPVRVEASIPVEPASTRPPSDPSAPPASPTPDLPRTGAEITPLIWLGAGLLIIGGGAIALRARSRSRQHEEGMSS